MTNTAAARDPFIVIISTRKAKKKNRTGTYTVSIYSNLSRPLPPLSSRPAENFIFFTYFVRYCLMSSADEIVCRRVFFPISRVNWVHTVVIISSNSLYSNNY